MVHQPEDDFDADAEMARWIADIEAGRERIPEPWEVEGSAVTISLGDACNVDPALLAAMCGPDGLGGEWFEQDRAADAMPPGPLLSALVEQSVGDLETLTDAQLLGVVSGAGRLRNRADYLEVVAVAEFARRRATQVEAAKTAKSRRGRRDGEFADSELAFHLATTENDARDRMDRAIGLTTRLPRALAGLAAGAIDADRAHAIWYYTGSLSDADAAVADEILSAAAPELRYDQLARKAAALEMKLDPAAARARKEKARNDNARVEVRREASGNASMSGRELAIADALAAKANIDSIAARLRAAGDGGTLRELRVRAYNALLQGVDPLADDADAPEDPAQDDRDDSDSDDAGYAYFGMKNVGRNWHGAGDPPDGEPSGYAYLGAEDEDEYTDSESPSGPAKPPGKGGGKQQGDQRSKPKPFPALINYVVHVGTLLGWSSAPGDLGAWGLTDPDDTRDLVEAASAHPRTRSCVTVVAPDGTAIAHGCARGSHPWTPERPGTSPPGTSPPRAPAPGTPSFGSGPGAPPADAGPDAAQASQLREFLGRLKVALEPIARGSCDHRHREEQYTPSRKLQHLIRARSAKCSAPGCNAQAVYCDIDHVTPWPLGSTDECNAHPACRHHHRCKHAPGWDVATPEPGVLRWTTPSGRTYTTRPTVYNAE